MTEPRVINAIHNVNYSSAGFPSSLLSGHTLGLMRGSQFDGATSLTTCNDASYNPAIDTEVEMNLKLSGSRRAKVHYTS